MTIAQVFAAASASVVALSSVVLGFAGPARADQVLDGVYTYTQQDGLAAEWTIFPLCVPTVGDLREPLELPVACTLHVAPIPTTDLIGGDARLTGGLWTYASNKKDGLACEDGGTAPIQESYKFDDVTMTGTRSVANSTACNGSVAAKIVKYPFTLTYKEALPFPVEKYPLVCEPGVLKRCR